MLEYLLFSIYSKRPVTAGSSCNAEESIEDTGKKDLIEKIQRPIKLFPHDSISSYLCIVSV